MSVKITKNFSYWEFAPNMPSVDKSTWLPVGNIQMVMVQNAAYSAQVIRDFLNKDRLEGSKEFQVIITSGVRNGMEDYNRLVSLGYSPSRRSDHFYGMEPMPLSAGAIDFVVPGIDVDVLFDIVKLLAESGTIRVGQLIKERQGSKEWIHMGNNLLHILERASDLGIVKNCKFSAFSLDLS